jgi:hypothetical protein
MVGISDLSLAVAVAVVAVAVVATVRAVRTYRRLRRRVVLLTEPGWWANQRDRRRLWRAVTAAEHAVSAAVAAGVPTGDLASVARRLRAAARTLDAGLASSRRSGAVLGQVQALIDGADEIARAATDAVAADVADATRRVLDAARLETAALRARGC